MPGMISAAASTLAKIHKSNHTVHTMQNVTNTVKHEM